MRLTDHGLMTICESCGTCSQSVAVGRMSLSTIHKHSGDYSDTLAISVSEQYVKFHTVLAIAFVDKINCKQLWIAFGTGQHFRYISIHELASALGPQHSCALPAFHIHYSVSICWTWKKVMLGDVEEMSRSH